MFYLGMYKDAEEEAAKGPATPLQTRLLFHLAHKFNDENKLMFYHQKLQDTTEDQVCTSCLLVFKHCSHSQLLQLSLASIHFLRSHYQDAIDIYKKILLDNRCVLACVFHSLQSHFVLDREYLALNVYVALCYYKLDYYDVSQEVLNVYLQANPLSAIAINLKACNHMRLYNGKAAETELKQLSDAFTSSGTSTNFGSDLMAHNMVVFRNGENALQVLPPLLDVIPEARLNLVIYYLRNDEIQEAFNLIKDLEPSTPQEYTLKGVVNAAFGQLNDSREHLKIAQQYFQLVGASPSECDTIPGRQCMASCFFLLKQFEDVLIYLNSIKSYFYNDDDFNWNYGIAKGTVLWVVSWLFVSFLCKCLLILTFFTASNGEYKDAEEALLLIQNEKYKNDYVYLSWLARCYIYNGKARLAWELYLKMETSSESFSLLQLIANDCYKMGSFFYSAKAFDVLERLDPNPDYWEGKRGACVGVFRQVVAQQEPKDTLRDIISMLRNTRYTFFSGPLLFPLLTTYFFSFCSNPQVDYIIRTIKRWAKDNDFRVWSKTATFCFLPPVVLYLL